MVAFRNSDAAGRTSGLLLRCVLYSLLSLSLIIFDKRYDNVGHIRRFLSVVAYPVQVAVASPFEGWDWFRENVSSRESLRADKARLEGELRLADFRLQRYEALEAEIQRLRGLRDNTAGVTDRFLVGDIMDLDLDAFRERVLVDKGARDGVYVGQAVLDAGGVFGQVARVEQLTSEVILISDAAHALPVQINRNGLRTIAVGTGDVNRLKLPYLSTSADVIAGDLLVTSGLGGGFPAGYPVGTVAEVKRDPAQSLAEIEVRPAAMLDRSRELLFVWLKAGAPTPIPAASASVMGQTSALQPAALATKSAVKSAADAAPAVNGAQPAPTHGASTPAASATEALATGAVVGAVNAAKTAKDGAPIAASPSVSAPAPGVPPASSGPRATAASTPASPASTVPRAAAASTPASPASSGPRVTAKASKPPAAGKPASGAKGQISKAQAAKSPAATKLQTAKAKAAAKAQAAAKARTTAKSVAAQSPATAKVPPTTPAAPKTNPPPNTGNNLQ